MSCSSISLSSPLLNPIRSHNSKNPKKLSRKTPKPSLSLPSPPSINPTASNATSYTRLPPKPDFQPDPSPNIIKLMDSWSKNPYKEQKEKEPEEEYLGFESEDDEEIISKVESDNFNADVKEKGVPAVMRCFDRAKIYVKAGDGGNGVVAFRREKYVPYGGPSGGDGGKGGDVYVEVDVSMNSLLSFRKNVHFRAGRGGHGLGRNRAGEKGEDVVVNVAKGTVVRVSGKDGVEGVVLLELLKNGERALLINGGRGGRGNASFKSGTRKAPKIAENGEAGAEM